MKDCCNHTKKDKQCRRKSDKKTFKLPRRFSKKRCLQGVKGFTMRSSCAPYKNCQSGGVMLPKLKPVDYKNKKYKYKLNDPQKLRIKAINEGIHHEAKKRKISLKKAAISKKGRFNILRIYRKNNNYSQCMKLTKDMKYMDRKYKLGKTTNICNRTKKNKRKTKRK